MHRAELPQEVGGLFSKLPLRSGQHDTSAVLEQYPRLARVGEKPLPDVYGIPVVTPVIMPQSTDTG